MDLAQALALAAQIDAPPPQPAASAPVVTEQPAAPSAAPVDEQISPSVATAPDGPPPVSSSASSTTSASSVDDNVMSSSSSDKSAVVTVSDPSNPATSRNDSLLGPLSTGLSSPAALELAVSVHLPPLLSGSHGQLYNFREHTRVATLLSIFSVVEIVSVRAYVHQVAVYAATPDGTELEAIRFGCVPRAIVTAHNGTGVVDLIPSLRTMSLSTGLPATAEATWGRGGTPFPPGLQLDLRAVETRHNYINFLMGNLDYSADGKINLASVALDFTVRCSGQNFGAIH